jgi:hypothetical protein
MIHVKKDNKLLTIDERELAYHLREGFDHVEYDAEKNDFKVIQPAKNKTVPYELLFKAEKEIEALKAEIASLKADKSKK